MYKIHCPHPNHQIVLRSLVRGDLEMKNNFGNRAKEKFKAIHQSRIWVPEQKAQEILEKSASMNQIQRFMEQTI